MHTCLLLISEVGKANGLNMLLDAETFDYTYHLKAGQGRGNLCCCAVLLFLISWRRLYRVEQKNWRLVPKSADWAVHWQVTLPGRTGGGNFQTGDTFFCTLL